MTRGAGPNDPDPDHIRTTRQRGRMTPARLRVLDDVVPRWSIPAGAPLDATTLGEAFGRSAPRMLDVGTGNGDATVAFALAHPDVDVIAVELHRPGLALLAERLDTDGPPNVRLAAVDVRGLLRACEPGALSHVRVLFPDPWPKRRHHERRLVDRRFLAAVADALPPGGMLHVATDWAPYAQQVRSELAAEPRLAPANGFAHDGTLWRSERPDRPVTAYEARGIAAGRTITDLVMTRTV